MSKGLKKLMKKIVATDANEQLAVADAKLGSVIKSKMDLDCVYNSNVMELMRCIRSQMPELISGGDDKVRNYLLHSIPSPECNAMPHVICSFNLTMCAIFLSVGNDCYVSWSSSLSIKI